MSLRDRYLLTYVFASSKNSNAMLRDGVCHEFHMQ